MRQAATDSSVAPLLVGRPVLLLLEVVVDRGVDGASAAADSRGRPGKSSVLSGK